MTTVYRPPIFDHCPGCGRPAWHNGPPVEGQPNVWAVKCARCGHERLVEISGELYRPYQVREVSP